MTSQGPIPPSEVIQIVSAGLQSTPRTSESPTFYWTSPTNQNYVFIITPVQNQMGINYLLIFGGILDPNALVRRFLLTLVGGSLLTILIALAGGFWLADRAMRPVKTITQTARTIGETDLSRQDQFEKQRRTGRTGKYLRCHAGTLTGCLRAPAPIRGGCQPRTAHPTDDRQPGNQPGDRSAKRSPQEYRQALASSTARTTS